MVILQANQTFRGFRWSGMSLEVYVGTALL
jgi:hypothetical protein